MSIVVLYSAAALLGAAGLGCLIRAAGPRVARGLTLGLVVLLAVTIAAPPLPATAATPPNASGSANQDQALVDQLTRQVAGLTQQVRGVDAIAAADERVKTLLALRADLLDQAGALLDQAGQAPNPGRAKALTDQVLRLLSDVRDLDQRVHASAGQALRGQWQLADRWLNRNSKGMSAQDIQSVREALRVGQAFADLGDPPALGAESELRQAIDAATNPVARVVAQVRLGAHLRGRGTEAAGHVADGLTQLSAQYTDLAGNSPLGATGAKNRLVRLPAAVDTAATAAGTQATALRQQLANAQHTLAVAQARGKPISEVDPINLPGAVVEDTQTTTGKSTEWTARGGDGLPAAPDGATLPRQLLADAVDNLAGTTKHWTSTTTTVQLIRLPNGALIERTEESVAQLRQYQLAAPVNPNAQSLPLPHLLDGVDPNHVLSVSVSQDGSVTATGPVKADKPNETVTVTLRVRSQPTDGSAAITPTGWGPFTSQRPVSEALLTPGVTSDSRTTSITASHSEPLDVHALRLLNTVLAAHGHALPPGVISMYATGTGGGLVQLKVSVKAQFRSGRSSGADQEIPIGTPAELLRDLTGGSTETVSTTGQVEVSVASQTLASRVLFTGELDVSAVSQLLTSGENLLGTLLRLPGQRPPATTPPAQLNAPAGPQTTGPQTTGNAPDDSCQCFPAGTPVATVRGQVPIQDIRVGDQVWAHDLTTGTTEVRTVTALFHRHATQMLTLDVSGVRVQVTPDHLFWAPGRGWTPAGRLRPGDQLQRRNNTVAVVRGSTERAVDTTVYNFTVAGDHDYYISDAQLLVHNCAVAAGAADWWNTSGNPNYLFTVNPSSDGTPGRGKVTAPAERQKAQAKQALTTLTAEQVDALLAVDPARLPAGPLQQAVRDMQADYRANLTGPDGKSLPTSQLPDKLRELREEGKKAFSPAGRKLINDEYSGQIVWAKNGPAATAEVVPVYFKLTGVPDFTPHIVWGTPAASPGAAPELAVVSLPEPRPGQTKDEIRRDDIAFANMYWYGDREDRPGFTWHHVDGTVSGQPVRAVILVPTWVHRAIQHYGGISRTGAPARSATAAASPGDGPSTTDATGATGTSGGEASAGGTGPTDHVAGTRPGGNTGQDGQTATALPAGTRVTTSSGQQWTVASTPVTPGVPNEVTTPGAHGGWHSVPAGSEVELAPGTVVRLDSGAMIIITAPTKVRTRMPLTLPAKPASTPSRTGATTPALTTLATGTTVTGSSEQPWNVPATPETTSSISEVPVPARQAPAEQPAKSGQLGELTAPKTEMLDRQLKGVDPAEWLKQSVDLTSMMSGAGVKASAEGASEPVLAGAGAKSTVGTSTVGTGPVNRGGGTGGNSGASPRTWDTQFTLGGADSVSVGQPSVPKVSELVLPEAPVDNATIDSGTARNDPLKLTENAEGAAGLGISAIGDAMVDASIENSDPRQQVLDFVYEHMRMQQWARTYKYDDRIQQLQSSIDYTIAHGGKISAEMALMYAQLADDPQAQAIATQNCGSNDQCRATQLRNWNALYEQARAREIARETLTYGSDPMSLAKPITGSDGKVLDVINTRTGAPDPYLKLVYQYRRNQPAGVADHATAQLDQLKQQLNAWGVQTDQVDSANIDSLTQQYQSNVASYRAYTDIADTALRDATKGGKKIPLDQAASNLHRAVTQITDKFGYDPSGGNGLYDPTGGNIYLKHASDTVHSTVAYVDAYNSVAQRAISRTKPQQGETQAHYDQRVKAAITTGMANDSGYIDADRRALQDNSWGTPAHSGNSSELTAMQQQSDWNDGVGALAKTETTKKDKNGKTTRVAPPNHSGTASQLTAFDETWNNDQTAKDRQKNQMKQQDQRNKTDNHSGTKQQLDAAAQVWANQEAQKKQQAAVQQQVKQDTATGQKAASNLAATEQKTNQKANNNNATNHSGTGAQMTAAWQVLAGQSTQKSTQKPATPATSPAHGPGNIR